MKFTLIYADKRTNTIIIVKDKIFNTVRYVNLTEEYIYNEQFPNVSIAIKDLLKYPEIKKIKYEDHIYSVIDFVKMFYSYEEEV